ncbi:MAG: M56 family metallopeptidase [Oscillospiraceae bacterium]
MEALFLKLVNLSITASWLVLAVLVLRLIFRKAPRWIFCLLWGLVALRLVCPVSLESTLSLIPSAETIPANIVTEAAPVIDSGIPVLDQAVNPVISTSLAPAPLASANPLQIVTFIASRVWLAGLAALLLYSAVSFLLLKRRMRAATLLRDNIRQSDRTDSPFVLGFFRPVIYLPYSVSGGDLEYVLAHERAHIRRGDHWWKPLGFLILAVYWFNPLMWLAYVLFCRDIELACDEKVIADMEQDDRRAYSTALLNCSIRRRSLAASPLAFGEVGVKDRVKSVMNYKKPAFWIILVALLACAAAAVCFLTVPKDSYPRTEEITGIPAPQGGADPYKNLEPAERAAAFLENADMMSYEFTPILMYGTYIVPVMEYTSRTVVLPDQPSGGYTFDRTDMMLTYLHDFDLSSLEPLDSEKLEAFETNASVSGLIHVGNARCRVAVWYDQKPAEGQDFNTALVFTFSDGIMCGFDGGVQGSGAADIHSAIEIAGDVRTYALTDTDGHLTVTRLSTGESRRSSNYFSAFLACIFDNTVLLAPKAEDPGGQFDWQVSIEGGATYLFDAENLLIQTENGQVYPIGGFEESSEGSWPMETTIRAAVLNGFDVS